MKCTTFPYRLTEPPARLKKARLDTIALVPVSLLKQKAMYQPLANTLPAGSVLCIPATQRHRTIMATITKLFQDHGRNVITLPMESITRIMKKTPRPQAKNLQLAF